MIKTAGLTFDFYDDGGETLRKKMRGHSIPEFIKTAAILEPEQLEALPDYAFAVVMIDGGEKLRKYACVDKGNVAVNTIYFLEHQEDMPVQVQAKVASNLKTACEHFGIAVPEKLQKIADKKKLLIQMDGKEIQTTPPELKDLAEMVDVAVESPSTDRQTKVASVMGDPYIDLSTCTYLPSRGEQFDPEVYAIVDKHGVGHFPLRTYSDVKTAASYFDENGHRLHPRRRHSFCTKVASRADDLGIDVSDNIRKYGSTTYGNPGEIAMGVELRKQMFRKAGEEEGAGLLETLLEKRASFDPEMFAETVSQLDVALGVDKYWDSGLPDPWFMTFGAPKEAEWVWQHGNEKIKADQLERLAKESSGRDAVERAFGKEIAEGLAKSPTAIFDSLPLEQQRVIARMAQQQDSGL